MTALAATRAVAQPPSPSCIPRAVGVPAMSGPPRWWDADKDMTFPDFPNTGNPPELTRLDDPRWQAATGHSYGSAGREHVQFRALAFHDTLYLSWDVEFDPGGLNSGADFVWLGIKQQGSDPGIAIKLALASQQQGTFPAQLQPAYTATVWETTGIPLNPWVPVSGTPPGWITSLTKLWTDWDGISPARWAFQMVIPKSTTGLSSGLNFGSTVEMFYQVTVQFGSPTPVVANYSRPNGLTIGTNGAGLPDPTNPWPQFLVEGTGCSADLSIAAGQIGTTNAESSEIRFDPPPGPNNTSNFFFARPKNERLAGDAPIQTSKLSAKFYIANWGSQADWNDVPPSTLWTELTGGTVTIDPAETIAPGFSAAKGIVLEWKVPSDPCTRYFYMGVVQAGCPAPGLSHQCMLVELSSGDPFVFATKSAYRNMNFVKTSSPFVRSAEISVRKTYAPPGMSQLPVYLYVETVNLPGYVDPKTGAAVRVPDARAQRLITAAGEQRRASPDSIAIPSRKSGDRAHVLATAESEGRVTTAQIDSLMPTYRVHVYRETGDSMVVAGVKRAVTRTQTSFGYWVSHAGELLGWEHRLEGANLVQLTPNLYKLMVPANGVATVTSTIIPIAPPRFGLSAHGGVSSPLGSFRNRAQSGPAFTGDIELRLTPQLAVEGLLGFQQFGSVGSSATFQLLHLSGGGKLYLANSRLRPFVDAGGGLYALEGDPSRGGVYGGGGVQLDLSIPFAIEASYAGHAVFGSGGQTQFGTLQVGARMRF
ncbi:MAG TPA: outer membrane beta-barrel protein [Gemmatimonadaceae bacterium]|nr:outer membrane beta-barrel protein [Gemmatimonadaceae bacterium]